MSLLITIKSGLQKLVKLAPQLGKAFLNSIGKKYGRRCYRNESNSNVIASYTVSMETRTDIREFPELIKTDPQLNGWDIFSIGFRN
jgi:hypothetical protein